MDWTCLPCTSHKCSVRFIHCTFITEDSSVRANRKARLARFGHTEMEQKACREKDVKSGVARHLVHRKTEEKVPKCSEERHAEDWCDGRWQGGSR